MVAAEPCMAELVDRWAPGRVMINAYGPTETTMCVAISAPLAAGSGVPPIGAPVSGAALFVLDGWLRPVPAGCGRGVVCGRCRGGVRVLAAGRVDRVAVCGVSVRGPGARMYRTGDLVRWARMASWCMWGAPMSRSRSAAIASNAVKIWFDMAWTAL
nr:AMP-binding protein [Mycobacterium heckeshornense]